MSDLVGSSQARSAAHLRSLVQKKLAAFVERCLEEGDDRTRAWVFTEGSPSPAIQGHVTFGGSESPFQIFLLDLYHGRSPTLYNLTTLRAGPDVQIGLRLFLILDSNVTSYLSAFFAGRSQGPNDEVLRKFLQFTLEHDLDLSPVFYFMESLARAESSRWSERASAFAATILDLQTLDRKLYLDDGFLASSLSARKRQLAFHGAVDSQQLASQYATSITPDVVAGEEAQITRTYAALLKAMLLAQDPADGLSERLGLLGSFMAEQLGAVLGIERFTALLHWTAPERFARLLTPLQPGARSDRALEKARSTAWDIYLGRLPEQLGKFPPLRESPDAEATCNLYYIATAERALAELLGHRSIEMLVQSEESTKSSVVVAHRSGVLDQLLKRDELGKLSDNSIEWERRIEQTSHLRQPVSGSELHAVVAELEQGVVDAVQRLTP